MSVTPTSWYFLALPNIVRPIAAAVPRETLRRIIVAKGSEGEFGTMKRSEEAYQKATAKDTTRTAALISERMNFILPLLIRSSMAVALAPRATTKMTAL